MQALILFSCLVAVTSAWNCPQLPVVENLNASQLVGTWYQQGQAGAAFFTQPGGSCAKAVYTADDTGNSLFTLVNSQQLFGREVSVSGSANWATTEQNGKLTVTISSLLFDQSADLWVLATDYDNYAVLYSCKKVLGIPAEAGWILRREQNPTGDDKTALDALIETAFETFTPSGGPDLKDFSVTDQSNCQ